MPLPRKPCRLTSNMVVSVKVTVVVKRDWTIEFANKINFKGFEWVGKTPLVAMTMAGRLDHSE